MAYIPPHKRHSQDEKQPSPTPSKLAPQFERKLDLGFQSHFSPRKKDQHAAQGGKIVYADNSISRWWPIGLTDDGQLPPLVELRPVACELVERKKGEKPLALVSKGEAQNSEKRPWKLITEALPKDLLQASQNIRKEIELEEFLDVKPIFVARFGKVYFHRDPFANSDAFRRNSASGSASMTQVNKTFYTNVPGSYLEYISSEVVPRLGMDFDSEKEHFHVKVYDKSRPDATITCKCTVTTDGRELEIRKMELNQVRHLVADVSCLHNDLDLRVILCTKRLLKKLNDEEDRSVSQLVRSAIMDPNVKGGLRWPLGKESCGDRFSIVGVWHTKYRAFKGPSLRLKLRNADRFDFRTSTGEDASEVDLKLTELAKYLLDGNAETGLVTDMLEENLKMIWENFLTSETQIFDCQDMYSVHQFSCSCHSYYTCNGESSNLTLKAGRYS